MPLCASIRSSKILNVKSYVDSLLRGVQATKYLSGDKMLGNIRSSVIAKELAEDIDKGPIIYISNFKGHSIAILLDHVHVFRFDREVTKEEAEKILEELEKILK